MPRYGNSYEDYDAYRRNPLNPLQPEGWEEAAPVFGPQQRPAFGPQPAPRFYSPQSNSGQGQSPFAQQMQSLAGPTASNYLGRAGGAINALFGPGASPNPLSNFFGPTASSFLGQAGGAMNSAFPMPQQAPQTSGSAQASQKKGWFDSLTDSLPDWLGPVVKGVGSIGKTILPFFL